MRCATFSWNLSANAVVKWK
ncbi:flagella basal-body domain protein, partial [Vibrio parahaemolyticus V-223/04]